MRIFLTGGTGFVGGHLRRALVRQGHEVVALARRGQAKEQGVTWVIGELGDVESLSAGMIGCDAVVHLVAIIRELGEATFARTHVQGTEHVLTAMRKNGITRLLQMSALGAGPKKPTEYYRTKWQAEELVRASGLDYTIFRPSIIFGPGDGFISQIAHQLQRYPLIPIIGNGRYPFAPISIHAVCAAYIQALDLNGVTLAKTFELCGPEVLTYKQIVRTVAMHMHNHKLRVHVPVWFLRMMIYLTAAFRIPFPLTRDQLEMVLLGNICDDGSARSVFDLPIIPLAQGLAEYVEPRSR